MSGSNDALTLDDLFVDMGFEEIAQPEHQQASSPDLALGSNSYERPLAERDQRQRAPLDGIDAVLVAYLMNLGDPSPGADRGPVRRVTDESTRDDRELDKPERGE